MLVLTLLLLASLAVPWPPVFAQTETLPQVFQRVTGSVVVVRAKGRDLTAQAGGTVLVKFNEVGSGVLVSADGKVLTAAHVVQIADEITVEFLDGDVVPAKVVASEVRADLALLQLARVPAGVQPAQLGDSALTMIGEQIFIVGAPYGIAHALKIGRAHV